MVHDSQQRGIAALPITVGVLLLVLVIGGTLLAIGLSELFVSKSSAEAKRGLYLAEFGAQDALMRISRDRTFATSAYNPDPANTDLEVAVSNDPGLNCEGKNVDFGCDPGNCIIAYNATTTCENAGCKWDSGACLSMPKLICSRAQIKGGGGSQKTLTVQLITDVDDLGKVTRCSWEQL